MRDLGAALRIAGRLVRALLALAVLAAMLGGLPWLLVTWIGWPLPHHLPTLEETTTALTTPVDDGLLLNILAILAWTLWAMFLRDVMVAAIDAAIAVSEERHGRPRPTRRTHDPLRLAATVLIGTVVGAVLLGPLRGNAGTQAPGGVDAAHAAAHPPIAAATTQPHTVTTRPDAGLAPGRASATQPPIHPAVTTIPTSLTMSAPASTPTAGPVTSGAPRWARDAPGGTYTVRAGDNLWDIADTHLGDPHRWREIYVLSRHRPQLNGYALTDPNEIHIGWTLALPASTTGPPPAPMPSAPDVEEPAPPSPDRDVAPEPSPPAADRAEPAPPPTTPTPTRTADAVPGDDGVVGPPSTPATSAPSTTGSSPSASQPADHPKPTPQQDANPGPPGITLTGNSWIDLGLATAIASAAALIWTHRRRRYQPRPPTPQLRLEDPDVAPLPGIVNQIRRQLRHRIAENTTEHDAGTVQHAPDHADLGAHGGDPGEPPPHPTENGVIPQPVVPALVGPLGHLWPPAGLGLTGPGAEAAARGFLIATLATGTAENRESPGKVVIPAVTLATLLGAGAVDVPDIPHLFVTDDLPEALDVLEEQTLYRTRLIYTYEADDAETFRRLAPHEDPLPPCVLIADATAAHERARIAALLTQGQRLDLHGILLGPWTDGDTITVTPDGETTPADTARHGAHPADVGRLAVLAPDQTSALLTTLAEAHTGQRQPAAPPTDIADEHPSPATHENSDYTPTTDPKRGTATDPTAGPRVSAHHNREEPTPRNDHPATEPGGNQHPDSATDSPTDRPQDSPEDDASHTPAAARSDDSDAHSEPDPDAEATTDQRSADHRSAQEPPAILGRSRARVFVLGRPRIDNYSPPRGQSLRKKSLELLVYLAVNGGGASQDAIIDDLLPAARAKTADHQLHTNVYGLRRALKHAAGNAQHVIHTGSRYELDPDLVEVDLWNVQAAITAANTAPDRITRIAELRRAVEQYRGPLAQDCEYEWVEPHREAARIQALDTHRALAAELAADHPHEALTILDAAIAHNPHADALYQDAMRLHHQLGDADAIHARHRDLTERLREIDAEPSDDIDALATRLVADLRNRAAARRRSGTGDPP